MMIRSFSEVAILDLKYAPITYSSVDFIPVGPFH